MKERMEGSHHWNGIQRMKYSSSSSHSECLSVGKWPSSSTSSTSSRCSRNCLSFVHRHGLSENTQRNKAKKNKKSKRRKKRAIRHTEYFNLMFRSGAPLDREGEAYGDPGTHCQIANNDVVAFVNHLIWFTITIETNRLCETRSSLIIGAIFD